MRSSVSNKSFDIGTEEIYEVLLGPEKVNNIKQIKEVYLLCKIKFLSVFKCSGSKFMQQLFDTCHTEKTSRNFKINNEQKVKAEVSRQYNIIQLLVLTFKIAVKVKVNEGEIEYLKCKENLKNEIFEMSCRFMSCSYSVM